MNNKTLIAQLRGAATTNVKNIKMTSTYPKWYNNHLKPLLHSAISALENADFERATPVPTNKSRNQRELYNELTEGFIRYLYNQEYPGLQEPSRDLQYDEYKNNPMFRAKAECLVAGVMHIIEKHVEM